MSLSRAAPVRAEREFLRLVVPWIENRRAGRVRVPHIARDQIEIVVDRRFGRALLQNPVDVGKSAEDFQQDY